MPQLTLQTFLDEKEITLIVTSYWSITDILAVASTCKSICTTLKNCWDVDALLNRWFENAQAFRQMLGQCGAIVSGSTALQYFDRTSYSRSDVDIIIPLAGTYRMGIWLLANDFTFQPRDRDYNDFTTSLLRVINANPRGRNNRPLLKVFDFYAPPFKTQRYLRHVQLIVIYGDPFSHILQYHSTAVMNVITWDRAISLFPKDTFINRRTIISRSAYIGASTAWRQKYIERGFEIIQEYNDKIRTGSRRIRDADSWIIDFKISDIDPECIDYTSPNAGIEFEVESTTHILNCALKITEVQPRPLLATPMNEGDEDETETEMDWEEEYDSDEDDNANL